MIPDYRTLPKKVRTIANWLLILKPGEFMDITQKDFGVKPETVQTYIHQIEGMFGRHYRCFGGVVKHENKHRRWRSPDQPIRVQYLGVRAPADT